MPDEALKKGILNRLARLDVLHLDAVPRRSPRRFRKRNRALHIPGRSIIESDDRLQLESVIDFSRNLRASLKRCVAWRANLKRR